MPDGQLMTTGMKAYLASYFGSNLIARAPGGGVENAGVSRAVSEMLLGVGLLVPTLTANGDTAVAQWYLRLFPVWPANVSVSFSGLVGESDVPVTTTSWCSMVCCGVL